MSKKLNAVFVRTQLNDKLIGNSDAFNQLIKHYKLELAPTILIVLPDGKEYIRYEGVGDVKVTRDWLDECIKKLTAN